MIVLGLLLILIAVGVSAVAARATLATSPVIQLTAVGVTVRASPLAMFIAGAASVALLGLGFALVKHGTRHKVRSRKEIRQLRKDSATPVARTPAETERGSNQERVHDANQADLTKDRPKDRTSNGNESSAQGHFERHTRSEPSS